MCAQLLEEAEKKTGSSCWQGRTGENGEWFKTSRDHKPQSD